MGLVSSISQIASGGRTIKKAYLAEFKEDGNTIDTTSVRAFQFYPETISDSRGVNFVSKDAIGSSHPVYQWVHGSERAIAFDAVFAADYVDPRPGSVSAAINSATNAISAIKSPAAAIASALRTTDDSRTTRVDVAAAIAWLRAKTYPKYGASKRVGPPPVLALFLPGSKIGSGVGTYNYSIVPCIMRRCDIQYEAFFNDGRPRIATVSLEFAETLQVGAQWGFVSRKNIDATWKGKYDVGSGDDDAKKVGSEDEPSDLKGAADSAIGKIAKVG